MENKKTTLTISINELEQKFSIPDLDNNECQKKCLLTIGKKYLFEQEPNKNYQNGKAEVRFCGIPIQYVNFKVFYPTDKPLFITLRIKPSKGKDGNTYWNNLHQLTNVYGGLLERLILEKTLNEVKGELADKPQLLETELEPQELTVENNFSNNSDGDVDDTEWIV